MDHYNHNDKNAKMWGESQYKIRFQMWVVFSYKLHIYYIVIDHEGLKNKMPNTKQWNGIKNQISDLG